MNSIAWTATQLQAPARSVCPRSYNPRPRGSLEVGGSTWVVLRMLLAYGAPATYREIRARTGLTKGRIDFAVARLSRIGVVERAGVHGGAIERLRAAEKVAHEA